ncbi:hypothetical protein [Eilatimonas milleporae]|nr:hypothetical protein [Eilatimonas milleporae]
MEPATIIAGLELAEKLKAPIADIFSPTAELQKNIAGWLSTYKTDHNSI